VTGKLWATSLMYEGMRGAIDAAQGRGSLLLLPPGVRLVSRGPPGPSPAQHDPSEKSSRVPKAFASAQWEWVPESERRQEATIGLPVGDHPSLRVPGRQSRGLGPPLPQVAPREYVHRP